MTHELSELSRWVAVRQCSGLAVDVIADQAELERLAERFDLVRVDSLEASVVVHKDGPAFNANGRIKAAYVQSCAVSGEDLPVSIDEPLALRFVPAGEDVDEEIELDANACDDIPFDGDRFDLGEAVAQSLALSIDPFKTGPQAEQVRKKVGLSEPDKENPFAALKGLR
ncbi:DUF177 domain-containing protein [Croceicoccus ponticola]|uniref:DUF177 domain-containing protein n=1 Tax=Croceicoccus ponticola TaxID=2217664 RepID=A0A437GYR3_9SPHN|nr:DUF177 domain-containing protein [Croceicoccus ponticola]RVQ67827.1 DUF177 domain-containing protein [Croceicoccus ponticola]